MMNSSVKAWTETVMIPTYEVGVPEKNPVFLEKRVYQGSSGSVYPHPVIEKISDEKTVRGWLACYLENDFVKIMILPEMGGRVQMAWDKLRQRHFVYYNQVIKPALVGLAGRYQGRDDEAFDVLYKSVWNAAWMDSGYLQLAGRQTIAMDGAVSRTG